MYIESVPNRDSPPAILLRESYREGGKVRKRTLLNLSDWPPERIAGFKTLLKGGTLIPSDQEAISIVRSLLHGHVAAALGAARKIGLDRLIGPAGNRCRDLVLALIVSRAPFERSVLHLCRDTETLVRAADYRDRQSALSVQNLFVVSSREPLLLHAELDGLDRIGRIIG